MLLAAFFERRVTRVIPGCASPEALIRLLDSVAGCEFVSKSNVVAKSRSGRVGQTDADLFFPILPTGRSRLPRLEQLPGEAALTRSGERTQQGASERAISTALQRRAAVRDRFGGREHPCRYTAAIR